MTAGRVLLAALLVAAFSAGVIWLFHAPRAGGGGGAEGTPRRLGPPPEASRPLTLRASADCRPCHEEVFREWHESHHAFAYVNPDVQKLSRNFRDRDCLPCHAARPVFETGLGDITDRKAGNRALERDVRLEEGVDCFTCHQHKNAMLGNPARIRGDSPAPCNPMPYAGILDLGLCAPCHDQHNVMQDWRATAWAVPGPGFKDCLDCHMPPAERAATADRAAYVGRSHRFGAAHDPAMLRKALVMTTAADGAALSITVNNSGAGHNVPGDERHRAVDLVVVLRDAEGGAHTARVDRYRNPYRDEFHLKNPLRRPGDTRAYDVPFGRLGPVRVQATRVPAEHAPDRKVWYPESTQIPAGESRAYVITVPKGVVSAHVRLIYKTNPHMDDADGVVMAEETRAVAVPESTPGPGPDATTPGPSVPGASRALQRADEILSAARADPRGSIPMLLRAMKDPSHASFVLVPDAGDPSGFRVEENTSAADPTGAIERVAAIVALAEIGTPLGIPDLLMALDDRDGVPAIHAAEALIRFGNRAGVPVLLDSLARKVDRNENANRILKRLSGEDFGFDPDSGMTARGLAVQRWRDWWAAFEKSGARLAGEGVPYRKGQDEAADRRIARYVDILGEFQFVYMEQTRRMFRRLGPPAIAFLEDGIARGSRNPTWRAEIAHVLGGIPHPESHRLLALMAGDAHPSVRARVLDSLVSIGARDALDRLRAALADADASVARAAIRGLARLGSDADAATVAALDRAEPEIRLEVACALLRLKPSDATFDAVAAYLFDPSIEARTAALDALNTLAGSVVVDDPNAGESALRAALPAWRAALKPR